jgi:hypothetical protein
VHQFTAGPTLAALERQRGCQAEAEVHWRLKQNRITPQASSSLLALLRQTIGTAPVHAGNRLASTARVAASPQAAP